MYCIAIVTTSGTFSLFALRALLSQIEGVENAVVKAQEIAGDDDVTIMSPNVIQQALDLGLVDEVWVSLVPVLFGEGISYFGPLQHGHLLLEDPVVHQGRRAIQLRYPVRAS